VGLEDFYDQTKQKTAAETDRLVLRQMMVACRKHSIMGVYGGFVDKMPLGSSLQQRLDVQDGANARSEVWPVAGASVERRTRSILLLSATLPLRASAPRIRDFSTEKR